MNKIHPELLDFRISAEAQPYPGIDTQPGDTIAAELYPGDALIHNALTVDWSGSCFFGARAYTALQNRKEA
jgi:hypothetical protein